MKKFFESENYNSFMYVSIFIVSALLSLSIIGIIGDSPLKENFGKSIIGFAISDEVLNDNSSLNESIVSEEFRGKVYSEKSYLVYYSLVSFFGLCIFFLSVGVILRMIRDKT